MRILLVEDTLDIGEAIVARFERLGHAVDWAKDGECADDLLTVQHYSLVILDVMLPGRDGFSVLRSLRGRRCATPVLVLTARAAVDDRVSALDLGADDYLVKPFDYRELEARARALLRRSSGSATNTLVCGRLVIDRSARIASIDGKPLPMTRRELTVIEILAARPGHVFSKEQLMDQLFSFDRDASANAVEQCVARVRRKLEGSGTEIRTMRGLGYQVVVM
ncbi:response regulator transcription factor [Bradyrhizobium sp. WD16]|uniref:response regulator transcription factor n=1 Tax=Bradyrhizobium sp. WD16 TaxID=1521768 RepID=UPI0020A30CFE|nr:response regulator transcription factor [Bradyrhizobium sp. WD16]UTD27991.1 DNA-binding response regulator [Bradyrhizobium sp. WD16]